MCLKVCSYQCKDEGKLHFLTKWRNCFLSVQILCFKYGVVQLSKSIYPGCPQNASFCPCLYLAFPHCSGPSSHAAVCEAHYLGNLTGEKLAWGWVWFGGLLGFFRGCFHPDQLADLTTALPYDRSLVLMEKECKGAGSDLR